MRKVWILPAMMVLAACGPKDSCQAPPQPRLLTVQDMTTAQKADALGLPPSQVPPDAVGGPGFDLYVSRYNQSAQVNYCVENEAYKARGMKDEMSTVARAVMATCHVTAESEVLATVLKYRNCAGGSK